MASSSQLTWEKETVNEKTTIDSVSVTVVNKEEKPAK